MLENYWESAERLKRGALTGQEVKDTNKRRGDLARRITEYLPLWIVTSLSIRNTLPLDPGIFDIVIVDEASQCDVPSALPLLFRARRAVIIGDPAQLKHFSSLKRLDEERISQQTGFGDLLDRWSYVNVSLFDRAAAAVASAGSSPIVLPEHHRSHPEIIEFANQRSYAGMLTIRTEHSKLRVPPGDPRSGVFWHHVSGRVKQRGAGAYNEQEAEQVAKLIQKFRWGDSARTSLGVVTPFRHQVTEIERRVPNQQNRELSPVTIGTVHRFQGDERDVMVFSPVIAEGIAPRTAKWVSLQENLINVAVTRARAALHVVGDREACLRAGGAIAELARYAGDAKAQNLEVLTVEEEVLSRMLTDIGLYFRLRHRIGETSVPCLVVAPTGRRYGIQFADGFFGESDSKQGLPSLSRLTWARIDPEELNSAPERVRSRLERLV
jgi:superfamily I DNA and/or RNA helicase